MRFLTHPRNAGRRDLRCPFGCRRHHRRECAKRRSAAHYAKPEGKRAKKLLNARRSCREISATAPPVLAQRPSPAGEPAPTGSSVVPELQLGDVVLDEPVVVSSPMLPYVRMLVWLIDGVRLTCREIFAVLQRSMRQRSIAIRRRIDYVLGFLHQHPP